MIPLLPPFPLLALSPRPLLPLSFLSRPRLRFPLLPLPRPRGLLSSAALFLGLTSLGTRATSGVEKAVRVRSSKDRIRSRGAKRAGKAELVPMLYRRSNYEVLKEHIVELTVWTTTDSRGSERLTSVELSLAPMSMITRHGQGCSSVGFCVVTVNANWRGI